METIKRDCFGYSEPKDGKKEKCKVLKTWYNEQESEKCKNCPFYKRHAED